MSSVHFSVMSTVQSHVKRLNLEFDICENTVVYCMRYLKGANNTRKANDDSGTFFHPDRSPRSLENETQTDRHYSHNNMWNNLWS